MCCDDLDGRIDAVVDAGPTAHGVESTVLDPVPSPMVIYRPGAVTAEQIREWRGRWRYFGVSEAWRRSRVEALPSPGVGLRHYAPRARLVLVEAPLEELGARLAEAARRASRRADWQSCCRRRSLAGDASRSIVYAWGRWAAPEELAQQALCGLRELDARGCTVILCPLPPAEGIGVAIRDRLRKAAE